ncbi:MAG TPA: heparan-alpha-glucosaminide N-acetyltransferase [Casimicrobiaceae bacterium]|nr:heparan-alpha-glucosaminide N-acetyltransferase [Casimicrobiaceae bacterium]
MARQAVARRERARTGASVAVRPSAVARIGALDGFRGGAVLAMIAYHFCFDLRYFGIARLDFENDPFWLTTRALILSSFLFAAGASLVLARNADPSARRFWRHVGVIAVAALAVSAASYAMFPRTYIWFGVLHAIAVALILARPSAAFPRLALLIGAGVIAAGLSFSHPAFDTRALGWIGFATHKPYTEDYVPLFPWAGVLFLGVAAAPLLARPWATRLRALEPPRYLTWLGRHSLLVYLVHQPLLIGALWLLVH